MPITTEQELSSNSRALFLKAKHANEIGNHGYVIQLVQTVLKESPGFLDGRKLSRAASLAQNKGKKTGFSLAGTTFSITSSGSVKKDPIVAMELAEKSLASDPTSLQANQLLFEAANKAGYPETASFALETLVGANPKDSKIMHQLAAHYSSIGENDKAVAVYNRIVQLNPSDLDAIKRSKDASASATLKRGKWEEVSQSSGNMNFRDLLGKKDETVALENRSKIVRTADQIGQQVSEFYATWEPDQTNVDISRRLAVLYEQWFEVILADNGSTEEADGYLNDAIWFYTHTNSLLNSGDANIARKQSDLEYRKLDRRIKALQDWLSQADASHPETQPYADEFEMLCKQRDDSVMETAKKRVADNPTDLQLRYELGEALMNANQFSEAIPELQRAKHNPNVRLKAMNLLGQCFVEKTMLDLAVTQFKTAISEIVAMDNLKKEILYRLGLTYEKMGKREESLHCFKEIYEVDYGYLDVAKRVESSYGD